MNIRDDRDRVVKERISELISNSIQKPGLSTLNCTIS